MAQSVIRQIERNLTASAGLQSRPTDKASIRGIHQGQRSCEIAQKGRTHDCKRPLLITKKTLASRGPSGRPYKSGFNVKIAARLARFPCQIRISHTGTTRSVARCYGRSL